MLKSSQEVLLLNKISTQVKKLTDYGDAKLPNTNDAQEQAAGELWLASALQKAAGARFEAAQKHALIQGVTIDKTTSTMLPGPSRELWAGEHFTSLVDVRNGAERTNLKPLIMALLKCGVKQADIDKAMKMPGVVTRDRHAHTFHVIPRTDKRTTTEPATAEDDHGQ
jgi:hypothetical protein